MPVVKRCLFFSQGHHGSLLTFWLVFWPPFNLQAFKGFVGIGSFLLKNSGLCNRAVWWQQPYLLWFTDLCPTGRLLSGFAGSLGREHFGQGD